MPKLIRLDGIVDYLKVSFESFPVLLLIDKNFKFFIRLRYIHSIGLVPLFSSLKALYEKSAICMTIFFKLTYYVAWGSNLKAKLFVVEFHILDFKAVEKTGIDVSNVIVTIHPHELIDNIYFIICQVLFELCLLFEVLIFVPHLLYEKGDFVPLFRDQRKRIFEEIKLFVFLTFFVVELKLLDYFCRKFFFNLLVERVSFLNPWNIKFFPDKFVQMLCHKVIGDLMGQLAIETSRLVCVEIIAYYPFWKFAQKIKIAHSVNSQRLSLANHSITKVVVSGVFADVGTEAGQKAGKYHISLRFALLEFYLNVVKFVFIDRLVDYKIWGYFRDLLNKVISLFESLGAQEVLVDPIEKFFFVSSIFECYIFFEDIVEEKEIPFFITKLVFDGLSLLSLVFFYVK